MFLPDDVGATGPTGVKPDTGSRSDLFSPEEGDPGASPSPEQAGKPVIGGDDGSPGDDDDGRPAKNYAREALRKAERAQKELASIREQNDKLVEMLLNGGLNFQNGQPAPKAQPADDKPPYSTADIVRMSSEGDAERVAAAIEANSEWRAKRLKDELLGDVRSDRERVSFQTYLVNELGLSNAETDWAMAVKAKARELRMAYPKQVPDDDSALLIATGIIGRYAAAGEIDFPDYRQESLPRTGTPTTSGSDGGEVKQPAVNPNAPNRGLPADIVERLRAHPRLERLLQKSSDPREEANRLRSLNRLLGARQRVATEGGTNW